MRFRPHRRLLTDSLAEAIDVDGRAGLLAHLMTDFDYWPSMLVSDEKLRISWYCNEDERCGWKDVHIVTLAGYGIVGFCEGPAL